ncbi:hypothetical protein D9M69_525830 [compost metagenome]
MDKVRHCGHAEADQQGDERQRNQRLDKREAARESSHGIRALLARTSGRPVVRGLGPPVADERTSAGTDL